MTFNDQLSDALGMTEVDADAYYLEQELENDQHLSEQFIASFEQLERVSMVLGDAAIAMESFDDRKLVSAQVLGTIASHGAPDLYERLLGADYTVSMEKLGGFLTELYERIKKAIKFILAAAVEFWKKATDMSTYVMLEARYVKRQSENRLGRNSAKSVFTAGREINRLVRGKHFPVSGEEVLAGVLEVKRQLRVLYKDYADTVSTTGDALMIAAGKTDLGAFEYLENMIAAGKTLELGKVAAQLRTKTHQDSRFGKGEVVAAPNLPGGKSLFVRIDPKPYRQNPGLLSVAESARTAGVSLDWTDNQLLPQLENHVMNVFGSNVVIQICQSVYSIAALINSSHDTMQRKLVSKGKQLSDKFDQAGAKLEASSHTSTDEELYRSAYRYSLTYARWATSPIDAYSTHALRVCRAALRVCRRSLAQMG